MGVVTVLVVCVSIYVVIVTRIHMVSYNILSYNDIESHISTGPKTCIMK